jgi:hypothetical protein
MTASGSFTSPACGAEFEVQERLQDPKAEPPPRASRQASAAPGRVDAPISFQCPACGADFETQEGLDEGAEAKARTGTPIGETRRFGGSR